MQRPTDEKRRPWKAPSVKPLEARLTESGTFPGPVEGSQTPKGFETYSAPTTSGTNIPGG